MLQQQKMDTAHAEAEVAPTVVSPRTVDESRAGDGAEEMSQETAAPACPSTYHAAGKPGGHANLQTKVTTHTCIARVSPHSPLPLWPLTRDQLAPRLWVVRAHADRPRAEGAVHPTSTAEDREEAGPDRQSGAASRRRLGRRGRRWCRCPRRRPRRRRCGRRGCGEQSQELRARPPALPVQGASCCVCSVAPVARAAAVPGGV